MAVITTDFSYLEIQVRQNVVLTSFFNTDWGVWHLFDEITLPFIYVTASFFYIGIRDNFVGVSELNDFSSQYFGQYYIICKVMESVNQLTEFWKVPMHNGLNLTQVEHGIFFLSSLHVKTVEKVTFINIPIEN